MDLASAIKELRDRNEEVPNPPALPTEKQCVEMEALLSISFHPDYKRFLLEAGDVVCGVIEPADITDPSSHTYLPEVIKSARAYGLPENLFPFCEDNADFYCLDSDGHVIFWSHQGGDSARWESLAEWIFDVWLEE